MSVLFGALVQIKYIHRNAHPQFQFQLVLTQNSHPKFQLVPTRRGVRVPGRHHAGGMSWPLPPGTDAEVQDTALAPTRVYTRLHLGTPNFAWPLTYLLCRSIRYSAWLAEWNISFRTIKSYLSALLYLQILNAGVATHRWWFYNHHGHHTEAHGTSISTRSCCGQLRALAFSAS